TSHGQPEVVATPETGSSFAQGVPIMAAPPINGMQPVQMPQSTPQPVAIPPTQQMATSTTAALNDEEIDRIWVNKAKKIVEQTHADPYRESQELGKTKVEYLKTRYNKDVKTAEG